MERTLFAFAFFPGILLWLNPTNSASYFKVFAYLGFLIGPYFYFKKRDTIDTFQLPKIIWLLPIALFGIGFLFHAYHLTKTLVLQNAIWDLDYIGLRLLVKNIWVGNGFVSPYYEGGSSYLKHHFAPGIAFLAPFEALPFGQFNFALSNFFVFLAGVMGWAFLFVRERKFIGLLVFLNGLYLYRLGISFHFEVLVLPLSLFFYFFWFYLPSRKIFWMIVSLLLFLSVKEDIAIYLLIFGSTLFLIEKDKKRESIYLVLGALVYLIVTQIASLFLYGEATLGHWFLEWNRDYTETITKHLSLKVKANLILEVTLGFGCFFFRKSASVFTVFVILGFHVFSDRPWYNEVYSYYSYTIITFATFALFENDKTSSRNTVLLFCLAIALLRNSWDQNLPLAIDQINEFPSQIVWQDTKKAPVYSQQNISILADASMNLQPLAANNCSLPGLSYVLLSKDLPPLPQLDEKEISKIEANIKEKGGTLSETQLFKNKELRLYQIICP